MFEVGEMVVYGEIGVCRIQDIIERELSGKGMKSFYVMKPVYEKGRIQVPADNPEIMLRPVISKERAEELIDVFPFVKVEMCDESSVHRLANYYREMIRCQDCEKLITLIVSIYRKCRRKDGEDMKFSQTDKKYISKAEDLLYGEFAAALGIDREDVPGYIEKRVGSTWK